MLTNDEPQELAVDRREETLITQQPGYAATEQVVHDIAAERRMRFFYLTRILWGSMVLLQILLTFRFFLRLIAANADSGFAMLIYGITGLFTAPFHGLIATPTPGGAPFEVTTLIAMGVYGLLFWGIDYVLRLVAERPSARSFTRTTHEQTPGANGDVRNTYTTISSGKM